MFFFKKKIRPPKAVILLGELPQTPYVFVLLYCSSGSIRYATCSQKAEQIRLLKKEDGKSPYKLQATRKPP